MCRCASKSIALPDNLPILAGIQPSAYRRKGANARLLKSRHPVVPAAQQHISSSDNKNRSAAQWADHRWNVEWADNTARLSTFIPDIGTHPPGMTMPRGAGSGLTVSAPVSDVSAPACTTGECPPQRPVSVAQKNKSSAMLSSNVKSIDLTLSAWPDGSGR